MDRPTAVGDFASSIGGVAADLDVDLTDLDIHVLVTLAHGAWVLLDGSLYCANIPKCATRVYSNTTRLDCNELCVVSVN